MFNHFVDILSNYDLQVYILNIMGRVEIEFLGNMKYVQRILHLNWTLGECKCCII